MTIGPRTARLRLFVERVGLTSLLTYVLLRLEGIRVVRAAQTEILGRWESQLLSTGLPALAQLCVFPIVLVVAAYAMFVPMVRRRAGRLAWAAAAAIVATGLALDLSTGRKVHVLSLRIPFVAGLAIFAGIAAWVLLPSLHATARARRWTMPALGVAIITLALVADASILPRLYFPFHAALMAIAVAGVALVAEGIVDLAKWHRFAPIAIDLLALYGWWTNNTARGRMKWAGESLARFDNARRIADERSAVLGRASMLAQKIWPPRPIDLSGDPDADPLVVDSARALQAGRRDVLLITIDALRADHVGAYGYARPTTPSIDALAAEGTVFDHAYTPAPHTSYAIASLMTGKYMRPILALEAEAGAPRRPDETWAGLLRAYGYRTAAFYPPAVFTVDAERFADLARRGLDFEYAKIEFAAPDLRAAQVARYLDEAPRDKPLFLWVHLFEPHEPYVDHPEHHFGDDDVDRYDSEIAAADAGVGAIVRSFRAARPEAIVMVTADHGEAFGEHGARYHGTTVYEEQVRVPLVVSAPGLVAARRVDRPVQLVDLLPTMLSALDVPRPPRVRGRDLGALLAVPEPPAGDGLAFAEVEDAKMLAVDARRMICTTRIATCALYEVASDPGELHALVGAAADDRIAEMRRAMGALLAASARLEGFSSGEAAGWPEPLRRALAGDGDAALDVAALLDDVDVAFRRRAAEALAELARPETSPQVVRALGRESDAITRAWLWIARVRLATSEDPPPKDADEALAALVAPSTNDESLRRWSALALSEGAHRRLIPVPPGVAAQAFDVLARWLPTARVDADRARAIIEGLVVLRAPESAPKATKALLDALDDVRLRVDAARAIGLLGDHAAAPRLVARLAIERHLDARAPEALALARVGDRATAMVWFARVLGVPTPAIGGASSLAQALAEGPPPPWAHRIAPVARVAKLGLSVPSGFAHRLVVDGPAKGTHLRATIGGDTFEGTVGDAGGIIELRDRLAKAAGNVVQLTVVTDDGSIDAVAVVAHVTDLPPPKPDASLSDPDQGEE